MSREPARVEDRLDVALVAMPFAPVQTPSIAHTVLSARPAAIATRRSRSSRTSPARRDRQHTHSCPCGCRRWVTSSTRRSSWARQSTNTTTTSTARPRMTRLIRTSPASSSSAATSAASRPGKRSGAPSSTTWCPGLIPSLRVSVPRVGRAIPMTGILPRPGGGSNE